MGEVPLPIHLACRLSTCKEQAFQTFLHQRYNDYNIQNPNLILAAVTQVWTFRSLSLRWLG
jgi:hypothetical protein